MAKSLKKLSTNQMILGGVVFVAVCVAIYFVFIKKDEDKKDEDKNDKTKPTGNMKLAGGFVGEFFQDVIPDCDNSQKFQAVDETNAVDVAYCKKLSMVNQFIVQCSSDVDMNPMDWPGSVAADGTLRSGDCPGRFFPATLAQDGKELAFNLKDRQGNLVTVDNLDQIKGDIGIDVLYSETTPTAEPTAEPTAMSTPAPVEVKMDDVKLEKGVRTKCGLRYTVLVDNKLRGKERCKYIFNINKT